MKGRSALSISSLVLMTVHDRTLDDDVCNTPLGALEDCLPHVPLHSVRFRLDEATTCRPRTPAVVGRTWRVAVHRSGGRAQCSSRLRDSSFVLTCQDQPRRSDSSTDARQDDDALDGGPVREHLVLPPAITRLRPGRGLACPGPAAWCFSGQPAGPEPPQHPEDSTPWSPPLGVSRAATQLSGIAPVNHDSRFDDHPPLLPHRARIRRISISDY